MATTKQEKAEVRHVWRKARRLKYMEFVNRLKMILCADCGVQYNPWIMEFDHRNPDTKKYDVSRLVGAGCVSMKLLKTEIQKCDVVCSNCHADRTHKRLMEK
jgi:hypothetical protein